MASQDVSNKDNIRSGVPIIGAEQNHSITDFSNVAPIRTALEKGHVYRDEVRPPLDGDGKVDRMPGQSKMGKTAHGENVSTPYRKK